MKIKEKLWEIIFLLAVGFSILAVLLICVFLFANGIPAMSKIGFGEFLLGTKWKPSNELFGIFPMIVGSLYVTAGAILFGVPIGLMTAIFLSKFCPKNLHKILKPAIDLLAGIPSSEIIEKLPLDFMKASYYGLHDLDLDLAVRKSI